MTRPPRPSALYSFVAVLSWPIAHLVFRYRALGKEYLPAEGGYVILVGRAANIITAGLKNVFHVRLVGSLERRIDRVEEVYEMDRKAATAYVKSQDNAKKLFLKEYFGRDIDDSKLYHLVVNTHRIPYEAAAQLIGDAVTEWFKAQSQKAVPA